MLVEALTACDAVMEGPGLRALRTRALWPGIQYELPDGVAGALIAAGKVRAAGGSAPAVAVDPGARAEVRAIGRPQGRKR